MIQERDSKAEWEESRWRKYGTNSDAVTLLMFQHAQQVLRSRARGEG